MEAMTNGARAAQRVLVIYSLQAALEFIIMVTNALSLLIECFLEKTSCYASQVWHAIQHDSNKVYKNLQ